MKIIYYSDNISFICSLISRKHIPQNPPIKRVLQLTLKSLMFRIYREQYQFYFIVRI